MDLEVFRCGGEIHFSADANLQTVTLEKKCNAIFVRIKVS